MAKFALQPTVGLEPRTCPSRSRSSTTALYALWYILHLGVCNFNNVKSGRYVRVRPQGHRPAVRASLRQASVHGTLLFGVPNGLLGTKGR